MKCSLKRLAKPLVPEYSFPKYWFSIIGFRTTETRSRGQGQVLPVSRKLPVVQEQGGPRSVSDGPTEEMIITASLMQAAFIDCSCGAENETATGCAVENWVNVRNPHRGGAAEMIARQAAAWTSLPVDFDGACCVHALGRCTLSSQLTSVPLPKPATHAEERTVKTVASSTVVAARFIYELDVLGKEDVNVFSDQLYRAFPLTRSRRFAGKNDTLLP